MKFIHTKNIACNLFRRSSFWASISLTSLLLTACGSGGALEPEAVVQSFANAQVLEGNSGTTMLQFLVTLDKPAVRGLVVSFSTSSTAKPGVDTPGTAIGGVCSTANIDFASTSSKITIAAGAKTGFVTIDVCGDAKFEPNETLKLTWSSPGSLGGVAIGTIVNDDAGGLNGTGATALMGGLAATGRDAITLTNSSVDGALGFSYERPLADCVLDKVTGLTWQRLDPVKQPYSGLGAYVASINASRPCGLSNWVIPTVDQLLSLMDASKTTGSAINADYLGVAGGDMRGKYWSRESRATAGAAAADAWQVDASNGAAVSYASKTDLLGIRLVSEAVAASPACNNNNLRFEDFNDGAISDRHTGLMWKKCPEGYSDSACSVGPILSFSSANQVITHLNSVNAPNSSTSSGYSDWRVPTKNELASLVLRSCANPATLATIFPGTDALNFITATLDADSPATRVWGVDFAEGTIGPSLLAGPFRLRLVRAGQ